jgi:hypothetical protein
MMGKRLWMPFLKTVCRSSFSSLDLTASSYGMLYRWCSSSILLWIITRSILCYDACFVLPFSPLFLSHKYANEQPCWTHSWNKNGHNSFSWKPFDLLHSSILWGTANDQPPQFQLQKPLQLLGLLFIMFFWERDSLG